MVSVFISPYPFSVLQMQHSPERLPFTRKKLQVCSPTGIFFFQAKVTKPHRARLDQNGLFSPETERHDETATEYP
jgi:hypothetical protein